MMSTPMSLTKMRHASRKMPEKSMEPHFRHCGGYPPVRLV
jgi:hypothetical protein